jgi:serine/threonine-protein kinase RsbW
VRRYSDRVMSFLSSARLDETMQFDIRLCLEEALINAIKYGNRLRKELDVILSVEYDAGRIRLEICDQGHGFDVAKLEDCTKDENLFRDRGRGIYLIKNLMDEVKYNNKGNCVTMVKRLTKHAKGCLKDS